MKIEFLIIKEENKKCNSLKTFISFLNTDSNFKVSEKILNHNKFETFYSLKTDKIKNADKEERYFLLTIDRPSLTKQIAEKQEHHKSFSVYLDKLIDLKKDLRRIFEESEYGFYVTILLDETSSYFSNLSYPLINEIENLMRKLIIKFMFMNIGINWLSVAAPKGWLESIKKKKDKNQDDKYIIQESLFEVDFIKLKDYLFNPYSNNDISKLFKIIEKAKQPLDLDLKILKEYIPRSNWDRYFSKYVKIDKLDEKWDQLYKLRNLIAHNRNLSKGDYDDIKRLTGDIKKSLMLAISKLDKIEIKCEDRKELSTSLITENLKSISESIDTLRNYYTHSLESPFVIMTKDIKEAFDKLRVGNVLVDNFNSGVLNSIYDGQIKNLKGKDSDNTN